MWVSGVPVVVTTGWIPWSLRDRGEEGGCKGCPCPRSGGLCLHNRRVTGGADEAFRDKERREGYGCISFFGAVGDTAT
jgi:hypothetical protein